MKNTIVKISFLALGVISGFSSFAYKSEPRQTTNSGTQGPGLAPRPESAGVRVASCAPATGFATLALNNVEAYIETGGSMWQERSQSRAAYEVPKVVGASGPCSLYSGALWLGGISPDNTLKLAAVTYRNDGNDFWPGPLTNDGFAEVDADVCSAYDKFFMSFRQDAQQHRLWFDLQDGGTAEEIAAAFPNGYSIPDYFFDYPAHGNTLAGQDFNLAPFKDYDEDGYYNPELGDYPYYDFLQEIDCTQRTREDIVPLFGDQTYYWIFNDKGNIHTESTGSPIGMEIRAQAFAFSSNDEINNMTFLNYVVINQGVQTLNNTYFGSWVDPDLGSSIDDYVGCDVKRGLGYCYNGDAFDEATSSSVGYGANPPAVGVDFFEGPYQDEDQVDNPLTEDIIAANAQGGIPYSGLGIGYGDNIVDNERFGMRKFVYYNIGGNPVNGDPSAAAHYYNYMTAYWKTGAQMVYGGTGVPGSSGATAVNCDYMFPRDTDPLNWGTAGTDMPDWSEETSNNPAGDRRFIQSAGPFTLLPGDYNNITVGVVWARTSSGDPMQSVNLLTQADDKAQALFDNCFELVSGPDAPDVTVQELENEVILMLSNENPLSTNYHEGFGTAANKTGFDPGIPESLGDGTPLTFNDRRYKFEGYLVYQLSDPQVGPDALSDITKARLIAQCDKKNGVKNIINWDRDEETDLIVPSLQVAGSDEGLQRSFDITEDAFATGTNALINHKTYYFMVLAYGYNNYTDYNVADLTGQDQAFLASRKSAIGSIQVISAIPHITNPENGGTVINSEYGTSIPVTRIEGQGNGLNELHISPKSEAYILENVSCPALSYLPGGGPVEIKVIDPLRVQAMDFELALLDSVGDQTASEEYWVLRNAETGEQLATANSNFDVAGEDLLIKYGISLKWGQYTYLRDGVEKSRYTDFISATYEYVDPTKPWLIGIPDGEGSQDFNWIRSGIVETILPPNGTGTATDKHYDDFNQGGTDTFTDPKEVYEDVLGGTFAPYCLVSYSEVVDGEVLSNFAPTISGLKGDNTSIDIKGPSNIAGLNNVDIVITKDKSKWTRCPVFEEQFIEELQQVSDFVATAKMKLRSHKSVDKEGNPDNSGTYGMGWFPGYAIDLGTGERLNLAFGEDSWLAGDNGADMIWNPSSNFQQFGGQHWIYVFKNRRAEEKGNVTFCPAYDEGEFIRTQLSNTITNAAWKKLFGACTWVGAPIVNPGYSMLTPAQGLIPNDLRITLRVAKKYAKHSYFETDLNNAATYPESINEWRNLYRFSTRGYEAVTNNTNTQTEALSLINVVPNPYYAFSSYETGKLDNRVKITNLPKECTITIYDLNGTEIRQFKKADPTTSLDWDLKNYKNIPIASGGYIIHIKVPNSGEKILKWFGVMRPVDLQSF